MIETKPIPPKPTDTSPAGWLRWAEEHFPHDTGWQCWLQTRSENARPKFGTYSSLEDLRGVGDPVLASYIAAHWWHTRENTPRILREHELDRRKRESDERRRLILLAKQALDGKLGDSASSRDDARATAQTYLRQVPEQCSDDDLADWMRMHQYAKRLASGWRGERPKLASDLRKEAAQQREMDDIDGAIGAAPAGKPQGHEQRSLYG